jgi:hypothetical protein
VTTAFISGASCVAAAVIALFFLRFWRDTRDRLFLLFGLAFAVFAVNRLLLTLIDDDSEGRTLVYGVRALAFVMIAAAIIDKNRGAARR